MCGYLLLLMIGLPAIEIFGIIKVGQLLGAVETMLLLATAFLLGLGLIRGQSLAALRRLRNGQPPTAELLTGPLAFIAALLLMVPGFLSDVIALPLIFPPVRRMLARYIVRRFGRPFGGPGGPGGASDGAVIVIRRGE